MQDKLMYQSMGGEVEKFLNFHLNKTIRCFGVCRKDRVMDEFRGYEHDGGLKDKEGKKWWVYFECHKCLYGHSFAKMNFFLEHTDIEHKAEADIKYNVVSG